MSQSAGTIAMTACMNVITLPRSYRHKREEVDTAVNPGSLPHFKWRRAFHTWFKHIIDQV